MRALKEAMTTRAVHCYKGRTALYMILEALDIGVGDEVIVPGFTCVAVPLPILSLGATPVYADIRPQDYNIDPTKLEPLITPRTRVIVAQHTFGIPAETDSLVETARRHGLHLIEDCCHTLTSSHRGRLVGTFGDAAFYSYEWGKQIVLGGGGSAIANTEALRHQLLKIYEGCEDPPVAHSVRLWVARILHSAIMRPSVYWRVRDIFRQVGHLGLIGQTFSADELSGRMSYRHRRMPGWQQRVLRQKLERLEEDRKFRAWVVEQYEAGLAKLGVELRPHRFDQDVSYLRYPILVAENRRVLQRARERHIEIGDWYSSPVHPLKDPEWERVGYKSGACPVAEAISHRIVTLPIYRRVTPKSIDRTLAFIGELKNEGMI